jgi:hypothetical protein
MADPVLEFLSHAGLRDLKRIDAQEALALALGVPMVGEPFIRVHEGADEIQNPYRHLEAFREVDAPFFYGRERETQELLASLRQYPRQPFVALVGTRGSGKSSLVLAGVVPRLRRDPSWQVAVFRPLHDPFGEFATALAPSIYPEIDRIECQERCNALACKLRQRNAAKLNLANVVAMVTNRHPTKRLLLVVDQFEELYTQAIPEDEQRLFLQELIALIHSSLPCTVLIILRVDFLGQVIASGPLVEAFNTYPTRYISSLSEAELRDAIEKPAQQWGSRWILG